MATSEGIPSSIDIEFLELNDNPYLSAANQDKQKSSMTWQIEHKIRENHSFWRNISREGAFLPTIAVPSASDNTV